MHRFSPGNFIHESQSISPAQGVPNKDTDEESTAKSL